MFEGDEGVVEQLVEVFLRDLPRTVADLHKGAADMDFERLRALGHMIKGSVGVFSAQRAVDAARRLEDLAAAGDPRALTSQAGLAAREIELLGEVLREEAAGGS